MILKVRPWGWAASSPSPDRHSHEGTSAGLSSELREHGRRLRGRVAVRAGVKALDLPDLILGQDVGVDRILVCSLAGRVVASEQRAHVELDMVAGPIVGREH
jgi:hypothetical protein